MIDSTKVRNILLISLSLVKKWWRFLKCTTMKMYSYGIG